MICTICDEQELDDVKEAVIQCADCGAAICENHRSESERRVCVGCTGELDDEDDDEEIEDDDDDSEFDDDDDDEEIDDEETDEDED